MGLGDILRGIGNSASSMAEEQRHYNKLMAYKEQIIEKLSTKQIISICDFNGIEPKDSGESVNLNALNVFSSEYGKFDKPKKKKFVPQRGDYVKSLVDKVPANDIIDYCRKRGFNEIETLAKGREEYMEKNGIDPKGKKLAINEKEILQSQNEAVQPVKSTSFVEPVAVKAPSLITDQYVPTPLFNPLFEDLEKMPLLKKFKDESELHMSMHMYLAMKYPERVKDEPDRRVADLQVDNIAIELKHFAGKTSKSSEIMRLIGQMSMFADRFEAYIIVLYGGTESDKQQLIPHDKTARKNIRIVLL